MLDGIPDGRCVCHLIESFEDESDDNVVSLESDETD